MSQAWQTRVTPYGTGVERITFEISTVRAAKKPLEIELVGDRDERRREASARLREWLATAEGVHDIVDDDRQGRLEQRYRLRPEAATYGITARDLATQLRRGFHGQDTIRFQRGREEIEVVVRLSRDRADRLDELIDWEVRTPDGQGISLSLVAEVDLVRQPSVIYRVDRRRAVTVGAEIDAHIANAEEVVKALEKEFLGPFEEVFPGVDLHLAGQRRQTRRAMGSLSRGMLVAIVVIYAILCLVLRSWLQPLVILGRSGSPPRPQGTGDGTCRARARRGGDRRPVPCARGDAERPRSQGAARRRHRTLGSPDQALADFDAVLARQPGNARIRLNRGQVLVELGRLDEAIVEFGLALDADSDLAAARMARARACLDLGRFEEAERDLTAHLLSRPDRVEAHLLRGKARASRNDRVGAITDFRTYLEARSEAPQRMALERYIRQ